MIYTKILKCLTCSGNLTLKKSFFICQDCKKEYPIIGEKIINFTCDLAEDKKLSMEKWSDRYESEIKNKNYHKEREKELNKDLYKEILAEILNEKNINRDTVYLEIGSGLMYIGEILSKRVKLIIGVDFCLNALKLTEAIFKKKGINNYLLILADIKSLPLKNKTIDLIYGGGVLEHFRETQPVVNEMYRVLRIGGVSFNTVPYLNLTALTYRQLTGNIPNLPILKQLAELVHWKILRGKHMIYGYEMSFLGSTMKKIHKKVGFDKVAIDRFEIEISPLMIKNIFLKRMCTWLACNSRLFWPLIKVVAEK